MLVDLLRMIGLEGQVVLVASAAVALYHGRSALQMAAIAGTWLRFSGVFAFVLVLLLSGVIPGLHLKADLGVLSDMLRDLWQLIPI